MQQNFRLAALLLLLLACIHSTMSNAACKKKARTLASLNMAKESLTKAKKYFPNCTDGEANSTIPGCEAKEISFGHIDVAINLIDYAIERYPKGSHDDLDPEITNKLLMHQYPKDCFQVLENGYNRSGVYSIWLRNNNSAKRRIEVFCDMDTEGGGWTVIQRRGDFPVFEDFFRDWAAYKNGFGNIEKDFWLGNDNLFALTNQGSYSIRIDLEDRDGVKGYALYRVFKVDNESEKYRLHIYDYSGDVGDAMGIHNDFKFSTKDQMNEFKADFCVDKYKAGWWFNNCRGCNLNGIYRPGARDAEETVTWWDWRENDCLETVEMKLRPR